MSGQSEDQPASSADVGPYRSVDITSPFAHLSHKEMARDSPVGSPVLSRRTDLNNSYHPLEPGLHEQAFQQQILQLKKQQQLQQQILLQHFQAQQQQLAEQHEQQLRQHLKEFWEHQKQLEEQRERREKERLEALKKKDKHEQSAVASTEVKQKLQGFLLSKKQREAAAAANGATITSQAFRSWSVLQGPQSVEPGSSGLTSGHPHPHPYRLQPIIATGQYESEDFPLRKTGSIW